MKVFWVLFVIVIIVLKILKSYADEDIYSKDIDHYTKSTDLFI